jgi:hypothetical protein
LQRTARFLWLFLRLQRRISDEGSIVYNAARVIEGALPYCDFFEPTTPGTFYLAVTVVRGSFAAALAKTALTVSVRLCNPVVVALQR